MCWDELWLAEIEAKVVTVIAGCPGSVCAEHRRCDTYAVGNP